MSKNLEEKKKETDCRNRPTGNLGIRLISQKL